MIRFLVLVSLMAGSAVLAATWPFDLDRHSLGWERLWRRTYVSFGYTLPGTPDLGNLAGRLDAHGVKLGAPVLIRIFKQEFEFELWLLRDGRFHRFATYPICRWSGTLGPKLKTGDRQAPEGFYAVGADALNPKSRWHRSFNLGFPNPFDRAHDRTGSFLMVHGGCSSVGCFAMTNAVIDEIWRLVTAALDGGQKKFQVQVFPFRMTSPNLDRHASSPHAAFWRQMKRGSDLFDRTLLPPKVGVCENRYVFEPADTGERGNTVAIDGCASDRQEARDAGKTSG